MKTDAPARGRGLLKIRGTEDVGKSGRRLVGLGLWFGSDRARFEPLNAVLAEIPRDAWHPRDVAEALEADNRDGRS